MNKQKILCSCKNSEDKLLISKVLDKIKQCETSNCFCMTEFLDQYQKKVVENVVNQINMSYMFWGGYEEASRLNCIFYTQEYEKEELIQQYGTFIEAIRITLPKPLQGQYQHKDYLGAVMKLGMKREKIGDILCDSQGADIIVQKEVSKYLLDNLPYLTRFSKAKFEVIPIKQLKQIEVRKKEIDIIVSSLRIDNVITELLGISRTKAYELLQQKRVFINYQNEIKNAKLVKEKDIIVIRGKGKYEFEYIKGNTKKNRFILTFSKYI